MNGSRFPADSEGAAALLRSAGEDALAGFAEDAFALRVALVEVCGRAAGVIEAC